MPKANHELRSALTTCRAGFFMAGAFSMFINLLMLVSPIYMMQVYNRVLPSRSVETLIVLSALAFALLAHIATVVLRSSRSAPQPLRRAGQFALASVILQIVVAAGLVQMHLPDKMKALHLAVGAGVWGALMVWALLARQLWSSSQIR